MTPSIIAQLRQLTDALTKNVFMPRAQADSLRAGMLAIEAEAESAAGRIWRAPGDTAPPPPLSPREITEWEMRNRTPARPVDGASEAPTPTAAHFAAADAAIFAYHGGGYLRVEIAKAIAAAEARGAAGKARETR